MGFWLAQEEEPTMLPEQDVGAAGAEELRRRQLYRQNPRLPGVHWLHQLWMW